MKKFFIVLFFLTHWEINLSATESGMPQLDPEYWVSQAFWLIIIFSAIYILIARIFIPKIKSNIDMRDDKIRKDLEEARIFKEKSEKKLKEYNGLITSAKMDVKKILADSRHKLNEDIKIKKDEIQKKIEQETLNAEEEIKKFKNESFDKINLISQGIVSHLVKDIFGEDLNKSSIEAAVSQSIKDHKIKKL